MYPTDISKLKLYHHCDSDKKIPVVCLSLLSYTVDYNNVNVSIRLENKLRVEFACMVVS